MELEKTKFERPKFDQEVKRLIPKWEKTGMLDGLKDEYRKEQMAMILENQRLYQEIAERNDPAMIPLVHQIYKDFLAFDFISVQTLMGPVDTVYLMKFGYDKGNPGADVSDGSLATDANGNKLPSISLKPAQYDMSAKTRRLHVNTDDIWNKDSSLIKEELIPTLAKAIREDITREIWTDLRNNAGTVCTTEMPDIFNAKGQYEHIYVKMIEVSGCIHRKTLMGNSNWLVIGPKLAEIFASSGGCFFTDANTSEDDIYYLGCANSRWKVYVDKKYPANEMLLGSYSPFCSGYVYSPYVPLSWTPVVLDPEMFCPRKNLLVRYAKKLTREGCKRYARIKFKSPGEELKIEPYGSLGCKTQAQYPIGEEPKE